MGLSYALSVKRHQFPPPVQLTLCTTHTHSLKPLFQVDVGSNTATYALPEGWLGVEEIPRCTPFLAVSSISSGNFSTSGSAVPRGLERTAVAGAVQPIIGPPLVVVCAIERWVLV